MTAKNVFKKENAIQHVMSTKSQRTCQHFYQNQSLGCQIEVTDISSQRQYEGDLYRDVESNQRVKVIS